MWCAGPSKKLVDQQPQMLILLMLFRLPAGLITCLTPESALRRMSERERVLMLFRDPAAVEVGSLSHYLQGILHPRW